MMADDDYELLPHTEIEKLRREVASVKKNPFGESEKGRNMYEAIERLDGSISRLIRILEDAQKDIIDEYQDAKPVEKLGQILDQNETIARALISINDNLKKSSPRVDTSYDTPMEQPRMMRPQRQVPQMISMQSMQQPMTMQQQMPQSMQMQQSQFQTPIPPPSMQMNDMTSMQPIDGPTQPTQQPTMPPTMQQQAQGADAMPADDLSLDNLPPLDELPPLDSNELPEHRKKKFLGLL
jgi:hypothetical protein